MDDCEEFLAQQEPWVSAVLKGQYGSPEILAALAKPEGIEKLTTARDEYEKLLRHCPAHLKAYRKQEAKSAAESMLQGIPLLPRGARRKDALAAEAIELRRQGLTHAKVARELNRRYPDRQDRKGNRSPVTEEAVRKMISRRRKVTPDKT